MIAKYKKNKNINNKKLNLKTGNSIRDFTNAEKVAEIIFKLSKKKVGGIFNIGSGIYITWFLLKIFFSNRKYLVSLVGQIIYFIFVEAIFHNINLKKLSFGYPEILRISSVLNLLNINNKIGIEVIKWIIKNIKSLYIIKSINNTR